MMQSKAENPIHRLNEKDLHPILRAYFEFNHLKQLYRQGWLKRGISRERCESVAEHSLGVALLALWLAEAYFPDLDSGKVIRIALIHDFGEIYAGDIIPEDGVPEQEKYHLEEDSVRRVFEALPNGEEYIALWYEYEGGASPEARFVRQIDRLEMGLQAKVYELQGYSSLDEFYQSAEEALSDKKLRDLLQETIDIQGELA